MRVMKELTGKDETELREKMKAVFKQYELREEQVGLILNSVLLLSPMSRYCLLSSNSRLFFDCNDVSCVL